MEGAKAVSLAFRIVALALSVAAAVVMGTANQLIIINSGRGTVVSYSDYSALVYFVVGSVISVFCGALALYLFVHRGGGSLAVSLLDTAALAILFSASGAALASRRCFVDGADTFSWRTGTAAAIGVCAAAAVWVAALTRETPRGDFSLGMGSGGGGSSAGCKHGCPSPQC
ncbi:CASP-like protein 1U1 [Lolium perenne]|uniref:CASP-like protein 1U1 n=1 Tax=Lolium perenne TaxID=4522 RepID=UPI0021F5D297|nr:CASP-like protein 1U1 [Lolium perenne]